MNELRTLNQKVQELQDLILRLLNINKEINKIVQKNAPPSKKSKTKLKN